MRKELDRVTMILADTCNYGDAVNSLKKSLAQIKPARTIFFTDIDIKLDLPEVEIVKIPSIASKYHYSEFIFKELWRYIETEFVLVTQHDGYVLNGESWDDKFYDYDFIGAPWNETDGWNVGNGGFSLRSQKLQAILGNDNMFVTFHPEDTAICRIYRGYLENKYKIKFAGAILADHFSFELREPIYETFGFHGRFHERYKPALVITRMGALGDVLDLEPLLHYYHKKGFRLVLNTSQGFINYFGSHYFPLHHPTSMDGRVPYREIRLDNAYEVFPKQLHLKSYFQVCGIPEEEWEIRKPKLQVEYNHKTFKLFKKYVVIHNDIRNELPRNIYGLDWEKIVEYFKSEGYDVLQIGIGNHKEIKGAIFMHTPSEGLMMAIVGSADYFVGIDSAPSHVAVAMDTPAIIFFGNVESEYIHPDLTNVCVIENKDVCTTPKCWHSVIGQVGKVCAVDAKKPPCVQFDTDIVLDKIKSFVHEMAK
jgi:ADP-heptose:LPS heptosyltransferase